MVSHYACAKTQDLIASLVGERGIVVARKSDAVMDSLQKAGFDVLDVEKQVVLAIRPLQATRLEGQNALILVSPFPLPSFFD